VIVLFSHLPLSLAIHKKSNQKLKEKKRVCSLGKGVAVAVECSEGGYG